MEVIMCVGREGTGGGGRGEEKEERKEGADDLNEAPMHGRQKKIDLDSTFYATSLAPHQKMIATHTAKRPRQSKRNSRMTECAKQNRGETDRGGGTETGVGRVGLPKKEGMMRGGRRPHQGGYGT